MEEVKNEVCKIDANFIRQEIEVLTQSPVVQKLIYLQGVLRNVEEVKEVVKKSKSEDKGSTK